MLQRLYINDFNFDADNIQTVKNALLLSSTADNTYFFALNIGATENATGSKASDIALSILSDMNIWY